ncbi:MAG: BatD family protein [Saccharospirillaceae bacterium]|nr:BatD family protein [Pseudomonadales bacterium]NRB78253.1 BatD family protein [Saccharospirillaceae bacterium]
MNKLILSIVSVFISLNSFAYLNSSTNQSTYEDNEIIEFKISTDNRNTDIDYSALNKDFNILNKYVSTNRSIFNNRATSSVEHTLFLSPKKIGRITIPSILLQNERTQQINLNIIKSKVSDLFFVTTKLSSSNIYIDQPVTISFDFHFAIQYQSASINLPDDFPFELEKLADTDIKRKKINGKNYNYLTINYQFIPQTIGKFTLNGFNIFGSYTQNRRSKTFNALAQPIKLNVNPIPSNYPKNTPWLPATNVLLQDNLEAITNLTNGDSLTRTIDIQLVGLNNNFLPKLDPPKTNGIKIYSEDEIREDQLINDQVNGLIQAKWAILPTSNITAILPEYAITWWDVNADKLRVSKIDQRTINVSGITQQLSTPAQAPIIINKETTVIPKWIWLTHSILIIGWLISLILWRLQFISNKKVTNNHSNNKHQETINVTAAKKVNIACKKQSLRNLKQTLMDFEKHCLDNQLDFEPYKQVLGSYFTELDNQLYQATKTDSKFDFEKFLKTFTKIKIKKKVDIKSTDELVSLYPKG